jgi:hypothetical protein
MAVAIKKVDITIYKYGILGDAIFRGEHRIVNILISDHRLRLPFVDYDFFCRYASTEYDILKGYPNSIRYRLLRAKLRSIINELNKIRRQRTEAKLCVAKLNLPMEIIKKVAEF